MRVDMNRSLPLRALVVAALAAAPALAAPGDAVDRIGRYDDGVIAIMKAGLATRARADRFEALVRSYYDMPTIAALVVGPAWATTSPADRQAAIAALTRHSAVSLAKNFKSYSGERFTVDPAAQVRGAAQVVKLTIASSGGSDILLYRMQRAGDGQWRIVDVMSSGVSALAVQRADLAGTVASGGAAGLAKRLAQVDAKAR